MRIAPSLLTVAISAAIAVPAAQAKVIGTLENVKTSTTIAIDGNVEAAWSKATALKVNVDKPNNGYDGITQSSYTIKSMRKEGDIYFQVQWTDPTKSMQVSC